VILGEWDNEPSLNVISSKTKIAANMLGRKAGDGVELADADGNAMAATIVRVEPLSEDLKEWIKG
jgi:transcription elongation GreA/GreB family factor